MSNIHGMQEKFVARQEARGRYGLAPEKSLHEQLTELLRTHRIKIRGVFGEQVSRIQAGVEAFDQRGLPGMPVGWSIEAVKDFRGFIARILAAQAAAVDVPATDEIKPANGVAQLNGHVGNEDIVVQIISEPVVPVIIESRKDEPLAPSAIEIQHMPEVAVVPVPQEIKRTPVVVQPYVPARPSETEEPPEELSESITVGEGIAELRPRFEAFKAFTRVIRSTLEGFINDLETVEKAMDYMDERLKTLEVAMQEAEAEPVSAQPEDSAPESEIVSPLYTGKIAREQQLLEHVLGQFNFSGESNETAFDDVVSTAPQSSAVPQNDSVEVPVPVTAELKRLQAVLAAPKGMYPEAYLSVVREKLNAGMPEYAPAQQEVAVSHAAPEALRRFIATPSRSVDAVISEHLEGSAKGMSDSAFDDFIVDILVECWPSVDTNRFLGRKKIKQPDYSYMEKMSVSFRKAMGCLYAALAARGLGDRFCEAYAFFPEQCSQWKEMQAREEVRQRTQESTSMDDFVRGVLRNFYYLDKPIFYNRARFTTVQEERVQQLPVHVKREIVDAWLSLRPIIGAVEHFCNTFKIPAHCIAGWAHEFDVTVPSVVSESLKVPEPVSAPVRTLVPANEDNGMAFENDSAAFMESTTVEVGAATDPEPLITQEHEEPVADTLPLQTAVETDASVPLSIEEFIASLNIAPYVEGKRRNFDLSMRQGIVQVVDRLKQSGNGDLDEFLSKNHLLPSLISRWRKEVEEKAH